MKKQKSLVVLLSVGLLATNLWAQIGINTTTPHPSAVFEINSPDKGLLIPRWESTVFNQNLNNTANGLLAVEDNASLLKIFNKTINKWQDVGAWQVNSTQQPYTMQNVGIGTDVPSSRLTVVGGDILVSDKGRGVIFHGAGESINSDPSEGSNYDLVFKTNYQNRLTIKNDGRVGIGTVWPLTALDVNGVAPVSELLIRGGVDHASTDVNKSLKWIFHSPTDNRHALYIAPRTPDGTNWNWGNGVSFNPDGNVGINKNLTVGNSEFLSSLTVFGSLLDKSGNEIIPNLTGKSNLFLSNDGQKTVWRKNIEVKYIYNTVQPVSFSLTGSGNAILQGFVLPNDNIERLVFIQISGVLTNTRPSGGINTTANIGARGNVLLGSEVISIFNNLYVSDCAIQSCLRRNSLNISWSGLVRCQGQNLSFQILENLNTTNFEYLLSTYSIE